MSEMTSTADARASSRRRVLDLLVQHGEPLDVAQLSRLTGLHANTLRGHLQLLADLGHVDRVLEERDRPGRPRVLYCAAPTVGTDDPYRQLAEELAAGIVHQEGDEGAAHAAGRHWGRRLRARARLGEDPLEPADAVALAADGLAALGFATQTEPLGDRLYITHCPFLALARENRSICRVHHDMLNGLFAEFGGRVSCSQLDELVRDDLCVARLEIVAEGTRPNGQHPSQPISERKNP